MRTGGRWSLPYAATLPCCRRPVCCVRVESAVRACGKGISASSALMLDKDASSLPQYTTNHPPTHSHPPRHVVVARGQARHAVSEAA